MKAIIILFFVIFNFHNTHAQDCIGEGLPLTMKCIFVFSSKLHSSMEVLGKNVNPMFFNIVQIKTEKEKELVITQVLSDKPGEAIYVFFDTQGKAIRYCNTTELKKAIEGRVQLRVE